MSTTSGDFVSLSTNGYGVITTPTAVVADQFDHYGS